AIVKWTVAGSEADVLHYEIEVAKGNGALSTNSFVKIGEVVVTGSTGTVQYNFTDTELGKTGARYYRLRIVNADGSFSYSDVKAVVFNSTLVWQVYPNPSDGKFNLVYQLNSSEVLQAGLYDAKGSLVKEYRSQASGFLQKLGIDISANSYASGLYLLRVTVNGQQQSFKLYKQ
ncbi:MAG TPA: T9SS type A sorting domain-containing protein, partial [Flavisolibacter sp.]|nr:T9SS type A sorting domain-containing protein [Flavisolibacter sp.]